MPFVHLNQYVPMNAKKIVVGIDVSAKTLDCALKSDPSLAGLTVKPKLSNTAAGHRSLVAQLTKLTTKGSLQVVMEATGTLHLALHRALHAAGIGVVVAQPRSVAYFAKMKQQANKTDKLDAYLLARYGYEQDLSESAPRSSVQHHLAQLTTTIAGLIQDRSRENNRLWSLEQDPLSEPTCRKSLKRTITHLNREIERLERRQQELITQEYDTLFTLLKSIKGIGARTATALIAYLGDFSDIDSPRKLIGYVGTNPIHQQTGTSMNRPARISKQGNARLRSLLYLCSLTAHKYNSACVDLFERLLARGKTKKQALIAVVNKLLRQVWAVATHQTTYDDAYEIRARTH